MDPDGHIVIKPIWERAQEAGREIVWLTLASEVGDLIDQNNIKITQNDIDFLCEKAQNQPPCKARRAIETLGSIAERLPNFRCAASELFCELLQHEDVRIRYAALEGLWQTEEISAIDDIERLLSVETNSDVRATAEHVLAVFKAIRRE